MEEESKQQGVLDMDENDSSDYEPSLDEEDEEKDEFTPDGDEIEAEHEVDEDTQGTEGLRFRSVVDLPEVEPVGTTSGGGRPKRGAAVRAAEAIHQKLEAKAARTKAKGAGHRVSLGKAIALILTLLVPCYIYSLYCSANAEVSGDLCGVEAHEWARRLDTGKFTDRTLQYTKADYAPTSSSGNIDLITDLIFGKRPGQPVVMLFVSSDRPQSQRNMVQFVDGLAQAYYNSTMEALPAYRFGPSSSNSSPGDQMKELIVAQLKRCRRGLFAVDASLLTKHFEFMETALEDGVPYIADGEERVYTRDATFIVMDTLKENVIRRLPQDASKASASIAQQIQTKHEPRWTSRFGQRIQGFFLF